MNINLAKIDFGGAGSTPGPGGQAVWGDITGDIQNQIDLMGAIDPLVNRDSEGYLHYVPFEEKIPAESTIGYDISNESYTNAGRRVFNIGGVVYYLNRSDNSIYIYDRNSYDFVYHCVISGYTIGSTDYLLWEDSQGRVYYYNQYKVDLETGVFTPWDMGGDYVQHNGSRNSNLIQREGVTYLISTTDSCAYIFNENTQLFDSSIPVTGTFPVTGYSFSRYFTEFDGHYTYDDVTNQVELVFHLEGENPYIEIVNIETELFPHNWDYTDPNTGTVYAENTRAVFVHPVTINGQTDYYVMGYPQQVMFKLVDGAWVAVEDFNNVENYTSNTAGAYSGDLWFGYGYINNPQSDGKKMLIWNFSDTKGIPELYRFDTEIQDRVENLENAGFLPAADAEVIYAQKQWVNTQISNLGDVMKLVEKEGIEFPVVDRPNATIDPDLHPDDYCSANYILSLSENYDTIEEDGDEVRRKTVNYMFCGDDGNLLQRHREYNEVDGEWVLQEAYQNEPAWIGDGWDVCWRRDLQSDPQVVIPEGYPIAAYYDTSYEEPFGFLDEISWEFNGFKMDENYNLGKYKIEGVEEDPENAPGEITYQETFIPYIAAEAPDTSTDATYVLKATVLDGEVTYEWVPEV